MSINTKTVEDRREVEYASLEEFLAEAEQLADGEVLMLGNWTYGQLLGHLARALNASIDGFPGSLNVFMRTMAKLFMRKMLLKGPLPSGFKLPSAAEAEMVPADDITTEEALDQLRAAVARQENETMRVPHLALGKLSVEQWNEAHLRHAEMHMSFVLPAE